MGEDVEWRLSFIENNSKFFVNLDV